jgi:hypothetical protein
MADEKNVERKPEAETSKGEPKDIHGQGTGGTEQYQRGGSGSEGGFATEASHGHTGDLTSRGGGTGARETEQPDKQPPDSKEKSNDPKKD